MTINKELWKNIALKLQATCYGYLLELPQWGNSNKYPKHMFCKEIRIKQGLSYISFCPLKILYNSKFILRATSLGTNAVIVMRVHCTCHHFSWKLSGVYHIYHKYFAVSTPYITCPKIWTSQLYYLLMCLKTAGWVPDSVDPDQMPHFCGIWSGSTIFGQT